MNAHLGLMPAITIAIVLNLDFLWLPALLIIGERASVKVTQ